MTTSVGRAPRVRRAVGLGGLAAAGALSAGDVNLLDVAPTAGQAFAGGTGGSSGDGGGGGGGGVFGGGGGYPGYESSGSGGGGGSSLAPAIEGSIGLSPAPGDGDVVLAWEVGDTSCAAQPIETTTTTTATTTAAQPAVVTPRFTG